MSRNLFCGYTPNALVGLAIPFKIAFLLDYYDGPVAGILNSNECESEFYKFDMLDWNHVHNIRIYKVSHFKLEEMDVLKNFGIHLDSTADQLNISEDNYINIRNIIEESSLPAFIMAWDLLENKIIAMRELSPANQLSIHPVFSTQKTHIKVDNIDWFKFLNIRQI